ncbi:MAG: hypothetical protein RBG13Loki_0555 [Promethearchaeota archaeon CR_4]|nr:MAG: hypothetical protein RBG13Loki_0555 [Candidatus Lokiarchaeota archaeon CR_4]
MEKSYKVLVTRVTGVTNEHFVSRIEDSPERHQKKGTCTPAHENLGCRVEDNPTGVLIKGANLVPQLGNPPGVSVVGSSRANLLARGIPYEGGRVKVWFANLEMHDIDTLAFEGERLLENRHYHERFDGL